MKVLAGYSACPLALAPDTYGRVPPCAMRLPAAFVLADQLKATARRGLYYVLYVSGRQSANASKLGETDCRLKVCRRKPLGPVLYLPSTQCEVVAERPGILVPRRQATDGTRKTGRRWAPNFDVLPWLCACD